MKKKLLSLPTTDEQLFERIKKNDYIAYTQLYNKYQKPLLYFTSSYIHDSFYSEEIVQEFFIELWIKREVIKIQSSLSSYLYRAVMNRIFNHCRKQSTYHKYFLFTDYPDVKGDVDLYRLIDLSEREKNIIHLVNKMPDKYREIYALRVQQSISNKGTARILDRSINTVEKQVRRVVHFLRDHLQ
jgi:RNA polymerase sigma-70 factor (ECF subfamily)